MKESLDTGVYALKNPRAKSSVGRQRLFAVATGRSSPQKLVVKVPLLR
jgi:hypothetical protein